MAQHEIKMYYDDEEKRIVVKVESLGIVVVPYPMSDLLLLESDIRRKLLDKELKQDPMSEKKAEVQTRKE